MLTIVTSLPTWAVYALAFGTPALTAAIAFLGQFYSRRATRELEARSRREEVLRNLRWAAELAVSEDTAKSRLGIEELEALRDSKLLSRTEEGFVAAALRVTIRDPHQAIAQSGGDYEIADRTGKRVIEGGNVSSKKGEKPEEGERLK
jgi:hypothetical protein